MKKTLNVLFLLLLSSVLLSQTTGKIFVNCDSGTKVYIDGNLEDVSDTDEGIFIKDISIGEHIFIARKSGYKKYQKTIYVKADKTIEIFVDLVKFNYGLYNYNEGLYIAETGLITYSGMKKLKTYVILVFNTHENRGQVIAIALNWWKKPPKGEKSVIEASVSYVNDIFGNEFDYDRFLDLSRNISPPIFGIGNYTLDDNMFRIVFSEFVYYGGGNKIKGSTYFTDKSKLYLGFKMPFKNGVEDAYLMNNGTQFFKSILYKDYQ